MAASVSYVDRKGEPGAIQFTQGTFSPTAFVTSFAPLSMVGFSAYRTTDETPLTNPPSVTTTSLVNNDKDFKATLGFEGASGFFKISIPAPKINVEGGIVIRWGERRASVPPVKEVGEVGLDGTELAAMIATVCGLGAGTVTFKYGRLIKKG